MKQNNVLDEVSRKLRPIARKQEIEAKYQEKENAMGILEKNMMKKFLRERRSECQIGDKTFDKIEKLIANLAKLHPDVLSKINSSYAGKKDSNVQTEEDETTILIEKISMLEKDNQNLLNKKTKYKKEMQILQKENIELQNSNDKIAKENKLLHNTIEDLIKEKGEVEKVVQGLRDDLQKMSKTLLEKNKLVEELSNIKKLFDEKVQLDATKEATNKKLLESISFKQPPLMTLINFHLFNNVISYLTIDEVCNLKLVSKSLSNSLVSSVSTLKSFYTSVIKEKNKKIKEIQKYDIKKEYLIQNVKLEQLIKDYTISCKLPGRELKTIIAKCLDYLNKEVKVPLGYPESKTKTSTEGSGTQTPLTQSQTTSQTGGLFGGMWNMFGYGKSPTKTEPGSGTRSPMPRSGAPSRGMSFNVANLGELKDNLEHYDELLVNELNSDNGVPSLYEFDFQTSDDIKMYLNKFLKTGFPVEKLTNLIKEICSEYSDLLFVSYRTLSEVRELELVKNALNERCKNYVSVCRSYEKQLKMIKPVEQKMTSLNNYYTPLKEETKEEEKNYEQVEEEKAKIQKDLELNKMHLIQYQKKANLYKEKFEEVKMDYDQFKNIFIQENKDLKYKLSVVEKEKNELTQQISNFNKFYNEINIDSEKIQNSQETNK